MVTTNSDNEVPATDETEGVLSEIERLAKRIPEQDEKVAKTTNANEMLQIDAVCRALVLLKPSLKHITTCNLRKAVQGREATNIYCAVVANDGLPLTPDRRSLLLTRSGVLLTTHINGLSAWAINYDDAIRTYGLEPALKGLLDLLATKSEQLAKRQGAVDAKHKEIVDTLQEVARAATSTES